SSSTPAPTTGDTSAAVSGPTDTHCNGKDSVKVDPNVCHMVIQKDAGGDGGGGGMDMSDYGPTNFGSEADDDDCKYHVKWTASKVAQKTDVTFFVVVTNKSDNSAMTGSPIRAEVFLNDTHPAPNSPQTSKDNGGGNYTVGPIQFDASGQWTVRFHFHEECNDSETSPHGHAAFLVQVP
ncbi:MAG TPA: hypothetical protein VIF62_08200, partial [Labilithrix sp.]